MSEEAAPVLLYDFLNWASKQNYGLCAYSENRDEYTRLTIAARYELIERWWRERK